MIAFEPSPQLTLEFWRRMHLHYGTRVVQKPDSVLMKAAGRGLQTIRIMTSHTFMTRYTTVIGRTIYPWFIVGHGDSDALWRQIVVCIHEHQHIVQFKRSGMLPYSVMYGGSTRKRALLEAEAYCCNLEMHYWKTGQLLPTRPLAEILLEYGCKPSDVDAACAVYEACHLRLQADDYATEATKVALEILSDLMES